MVNAKKILYIKKIAKEVVQKEKIKKKQGMKCVYCGCTNELIMTIDHKIPLSRGGKDNDSNKQVCCRICNALKGPLTDEEYKSYFKNLLEMKKLCKMQIRIEHPKVVFHQDWFPMIEESKKEKVKR